MLQRDYSLICQLKVLKLKRGKDRSFVAPVFFMLEKSLAKVKMYKLIKAPGAIRSIYLCTINICCLDHRGLF